MSLLCKHDDGDGFLLFFSRFFHVSFRFTLLLADTKSPISQPSTSVCCNFRFPIYLLLFMSSQNFIHVPNHFSHFAQFQFSLFFLFVKPLRCRFCHKHLTSFPQLAIFSFLHFARIRICAHIEQTHKIYLFLFRSHLVHVFTSPECINGICNNKMRVANACGSKQQFPRFGCSWQMGNLHLILIFCHRQEKTMQLK